MKKKSSGKFNSWNKWKDYRLNLMEDVSVEKPIYEDVVGEDYSVKVKSNDVEIVGGQTIAGNENFDTEATDFTIFFGIEIEYRSWGIKGIYVNAKRAIGSVFVNIWTEGEDRTVEVDCSEFELETEVTIDSDTISIHNIVVDIENKKIICS